MRVANTYYNQYYPYVKSYTPLPNKRAGTDIAERDQRHSGQDTLPGYVDYTSGNIKAIDILKDFRMTMNQVGVSGQVLEDVNQHLSEVDLELKKQAPSLQNIRENFERAASRLDQYIGESLQKPSDVVSQWIHALFTHPVNIVTENKVDTSPIASAKVAIKHTEIASQTAFKNNANPFIDPIKDPLLPSPDDIKRPAESKEYTKEEYPSFTGTNTRKKNYFEIPTVPLSVKGTEKLEAANTLLDLGKIKDAESLYKESISFSRKEGDINTAGQGFYGIGMIRDDSGDVVGALKHYQQAAKLSFKAKNYELGAKTHYGIGSIYKDVEKPFLALEHFHMSLGFDGAADNVQEQVKTLNDIAGLYKENSQPKKAYKYYNVAYSLANEEKMHSFQSLILGNVGNLYENMGNREKASFYYNKALEFSASETFKEDFNQEEYLKSLNNLVAMHLKSGNTNMAKKFLTSSIDFGKKIGDNKIRWAAQSALLKIDT